MTDEEVEKIIRSNMNLQMNLAGIRADFEEKLQRTWVGLSMEEFKFIASKYLLSREVGLEYFQEEIEAKLKEKNNV